MGVAYQDLLALGSTFKGHKTTNRSNFLSFTESKSGQLIYKLVQRLSSHLDVKLRDLPQRVILEMEATLTAAINGGRYSTDVVMFKVYKEFVTSTTADIAKAFKEYRGANSGISVLKNVKVLELDELICDYQMFLDVGVRTPPIPVRKVKGEVLKSMPEGDWEEARRCGGIRDHWVIIPNYSYDNLFKVV